MTNMNNCECPDTNITHFHSLVPYAWKISKEKKVVTGFICEQCFAVINMSDIHKFNQGSDTKSQTDTSVPN